MLETFKELLSGSGFMPHIHCYMDRPALVWTMAVTDTLIGVSYVAISVTLYFLVRKIKLPFHVVFLAFGAFILACGTTHFMEVVNLWVPSYWLAAAVKIITAVASITTAIYLLKLFPTFLEFGEAAKDLAWARSNMEEFFRRRVKTPPELSRLLSRAFYWPAAVALGLVLIALVEATYLRATQHSVDRSNEVIRQGHEMKESAIKAQAELRGMQFNAIERSREEIQANVVNFERDNEMLMGLVSDSEDRKQKLGEVKAAFDDWLAFANPILAGGNAGRGDAGTLRAFFGANKALNVKVEAACDRFLNFERDLRRSRSGTADRIVMYIFLTIGALTLFLGAVFAVVGRRSLLWISNSYGRALESEKIALERLRQASASRDEFFSIASHELKTPLTSLKLKAQLSARGIGIMAKDEKEKRFITELNEQVDRLVRLVDDMLDISRFKVGTLSLQVAELGLTAMVKATIERLQSQLQASGIMLELDAGRDVRVEGDRLRLEQAFSNLVVNAIKYAPGKPLHVRVTEAKGRARIEVRDEGPGVAQADQDRIFQRFERATAASHVSGLGVGLFLARAIVEAHHGTLTLKSAPGHGAAFFIELPAQGSSGRLESSLKLGEA